jgi:hypothetical protein
MKFAIAAIKSIESRKKDSKWEISGKEVQITENFWKKSPII